MDDVDNFRQKTEKKSILGIYAKQPLPGRVKTRLCPPLSHDQAAVLYECSLRETVARMQQLDCALVLCYAGDRDWFQRAFPGLALQPQLPVDLGGRMAASLGSFLQQGYRQAVLIGSDTPDLPLALVEQAFGALEQAEVVLAPAHDGGYVLIGEAVHRPELFTEIAWSTGAVLAETLRRLKQQQISYRQLDSWEDLDDMPSLQRLLQRSPAAATAGCLRELLA